MAKKQIALIATGGTIAMIKNKDGGLSPAMSAEDFAKVPELSNYSIRPVKAFEPLIDSSNTALPLWEKLARKVVRQINDPDVSGVIITHGTDTLPDTAQYLHLSLSNITKPVVITGAQFGADEKEYDGNRNMGFSAKFAQNANFGGVAVVFNDSLSGYRGDLQGRVMSPDNLVKDSIWETNPFRPIYRDNIGVVTSHSIKLNSSDLPRKSGKTKFSSLWNNNVYLLKLKPTMTAKQVKKIVHANWDGLVVEGYGAGYFRVNQGEDDKGKFVKTLHSDVDSLLDAFKGLDIPIVLGSRAYGLITDKYEVGQIIRNEIPTIVDPGDCVTDFAYMKLQKMLGEGKSLNQIRRGFLA